ncbi:signal peptidase II [Arthrobacter sp. MDT3-44]
MVPGTAGPGSASPEPASPEPASPEPASAGPAGGATAAGAAPGRSHARRVPARYGVVMLLCTLTAYVIDQLTKAWVVSTMSEGQIIPVLPPLLNWRFIRNPGAAFSIGTDYTWVFTIIMVVVAVAIALQVRNIASWGWSVALGLVLGGALGNLTDRLLREPSFGQGHVVDFIALPNFAIFNIADSAVVSGVVLICILTLRGIGMDGRRSSDTQAAGRAADAPEGRTAERDGDGR